MRVTLTCPKCGKRYVLKGDLAGREAKCACGMIIQVPSEFAEAGAAGLNPNASAICAKCLKTIQAGQPREIFDGKLCCVECAELFGRRAEECGEGHSSAKDNDEGGFFNPNIPPSDPEHCAERVRSSHYQRLLGFAIGSLILSVLLYIKRGLIGAAFGLGLGVIFSFVFCKRGRDFDRKVLGDKELSEQYVEKLRMPKGYRIELVLCILVIGLCLALLQLCRHFRPESFDDFIYSFLSTKNLALLAILSILNIPIFILIGGAIVGSRQEYWRIAKWHFVPFRFFLKSWFDFLTSIRMRDIWLVWRADLISTGIVVVEYLIIKFIFMN